MSKFKREERYIVLKRKHLEGMFVGVRGKIALWGLNYILKRLPKGECVVVESDWSIYEKVWRLVEAEYNKDLFEK